MAFSSVFYKPKIKKKKKAVKKKDHIDRTSFHDWLPLS